MHQSAPQEYHEEEGDQLPCLSEADAVNFKNTTNPKMSDRAGSTANDGAMVDNDWRISDQRLWFDLMSNPVRKQKRGYRSADIKGVLDKCRSANGEDL